MSAKKEGSKEDLELFFSLPSKDSETPIDISKAKEEKEALYDFQGSLGDLDSWLRHEDFRLRKKNEDMERDLRKSNANRVFGVTVVWIVFIAYIIIAKAMCPLFHLTQTEFLFVIGSLTTSVLTFYLLVIKYLFYRKQ